MLMHFDRAQLKLEAALLEEKGFSPEAAENISLFKQVIEYAACFPNTIGDFDREELGDRIFDKLDNLIGFIETAEESISEIFKSEEELIASGFYTNRNIYELSS